MFILVKKSNLITAFDDFQLPVDIISLSDTLIIHFETDDSMSMKGFSISYVATAPYDESESYDNSDEIDVTPFPGSLKSIYYSKSDEYDEYGDYNDNKLSMNMGQRRIFGRNWR